MSSRNSFLGIMLTEQEKAKIRELALREGMTMSAYIRMRLLKRIEKEHGNEREDIQTE